MSASTLSSPLTRPTADRLWLQAALLLSALAIPTAIAMVLEERTINGIDVWIKPLKFQVSTALHLATLYLAAQLMSEAQRRTPLFTAIAWASAFAGIVEIGYITLKAGQGQASHFSMNTPLDQALYALMGVGAVTLLLPAFWLGWRFLRRPGDFTGSDGLKFGIGLGFFAGAALTLGMAGYMSQTGSHFVAQDAAGLSDAGGLAITGWSRQAGDLRVAHFFATHMMQVLPLTGLTGALVLGKQGRRARIAVWLAFLAMAGASLVTFAQALSGQPFIA